MKTEDNYAVAATQSRHRTTMSGSHHYQEHEHHNDTQAAFVHDLQYSPVAADSLKAEATAIMAEVAILTFALATLVGGMVTRQPEIGDLAINFVAIILEAMPFMMIGALAGGLIEAFVPQEFVQRALAGRTKATVFVAAGLGVVLPICECAIVPIVRRLMNKGVPLPAAIAFLLGAPIVNPIVAASTWLAYRGNWGIVTTRMVCGYVLAVSVALIVNAMFRGQRVAPLNNDVTCEHGCCHCAEHLQGSVPLTFSEKIMDAVAHARDDFFSIGKYLIVGAFVAALARATIDVVAFRELFGSPVLSILAMMGLAVALNLCSETDAFIAAGFRSVFPETAQMAFMVLGPMLDLKLMLANLTIFRSRIVVVLSMSTVIAVLIAMLVLHYGLGGIPGAK